MARHRIYRRYGRRHTRHTHHSETHSLLGTVFGGSAAAIPFVASNTGTGISVVEDILYNIQNATQGGIVDLHNLGDELKGGLWNNMGEVIGFGLVGAGFAYAGKKLKLNKLTKFTKKWSIF